ncbi:3-dehydroshikimate dehydratase [Lophium mytilinum]|uniref:3-dehydroshikimate dehydratase n=1 Tax=Lophium mytilinum TaxID=390894 RepID=A0A6A6R4C3_9PEZI|nr:3-dehydroshikimate dehydratase [Lophium mytilinum]
MSIDLATLTNIPISYASCSIGNSSTPLPEKLDALSKTGFEGIELSFPDILAFGKLHLGHDIKPDNYGELEKVATEIKDMCKARNLKIMLLQPFANFEGWPQNSEEHKDALERAAGWIRIMQACGCDILQVGSTDTPIEKLDKSRIIPDLRHLADLLAAQNFRLAYENWCWSSHAPDWRDCWDIVKAVDRPNIGLCLDTFQTAGGEWADPTTSSGIIESIPREELEEKFHKSMMELGNTIPKDKIYLLQISDAYKVPRPIDPSPDESGLRPRGRWSHDFRPLPYNGGYLPIVEVARGVLRTGFRGWFSYEVFDGGPEGKDIEREWDLLSYAKTARTVQDRLMMECGGKYM